jgi:hypothetical protein
MNLITGKRLVMVGLSAWVLLGLLDVFIWGPLAQVPGETLAGIYVVIADSVGCCRGHYSGLRSASL